MKKKVSVFGKKLPVFVLVLLGIGLVSAALITTWGTITGLVTVSQGLFLDGKAWNDTTITYTEPVFTSLESKTVSSGSHNLENTGITVDATVTLNTVCTEAGTGDCGETDSSIEYLLSSTGSVGSSNENRIHINAGDVGVTTLSDLTSISWDVDTSGYMAHVDVLIDTTGDGLADDALVFEHAKVDSTNCENTPYPEGEMDTFGPVSGIVDSSAQAWLTTGAAGPGCTLNVGASFWIYSLSDWKSGQTANSKSISGTTPVIGFQIETDNWIMDSESDVSDLEINGATVTKITILAGDDLDFSIETYFPKMMLPDTYTITTTVDAV